MGTQRQDGARGYQLVWRRDADDADADADDLLSHMLEREVCVPAGSAVLCPFKLARSLYESMTIPGKEKLSEALLIPHTYYVAEDASVTYLVNDSERDATLK